MHSIPPEFVAVTRRPRKRVLTATARLNCERLEDRTTPAILTVTSLADSGNGSLREKISLANSNADVDTIRFSDDLSGGTINLVTIADRTMGASAFLITSIVTIEGRGQILQRAANSGAMRLFLVGSSGNLRLENLGLENGLAQGGNGGSGVIGGGGGAGLGGAIYNLGALTIVGSTFLNNRAVGGDGGDGGLDNGGYGLGGSPSANGGVLPPPVTLPPQSPPMAPPTIPPVSPPLVPPTEGGEPVYKVNPPNNGVSPSKNVHDATLAILHGSGGATSPPPATSPPATLPPVPVVPPLPPVIAYVPNGYGRGGNGGLATGIGGFGGGASGRIDHATAGGFGGGSSTNAAGAGGAGMGGAIFNQSGNVTIINSTFSSNSAIGGAGGTLNSTAAQDGSALGGAIFNLSGVITLIQSTLTRNSISIPHLGNALTRGAGVYSIAIPIEGYSGVSGQIELSNSIAIQNTGGPDIFNQDTDGVGSALVAVLPNIVGSIGGANFNRTGVKSDDPGLGALQYQGGFTKTISIRLGGSAHNTGGEIPRLMGPATDQRGFTRDAKPDLGAFEIISPLAVPPAPPASGSANPDGSIQFVQSIYRTLVGRSPSVGEVASGLNLINSTGTSSFITSVFNTTEYRTIQVRQFIQVILGRTASTDETNRWVNRLLTGAGELAVLEEILKSAEFAGSLNDPSFVSKLSLSLLNRDLIGTERTTILDRLNSGTTRDIIIHELLFSTEFLTTQLQAYHQGYIGQLSDANSLLEWAERIQSGALMLDAFPKAVLDSTAYRQVNIRVSS